MYNELVFTEAVEQVERILETQSSDEIADRIERICPHPDLSMAVIMLLVFKAKGVAVDATGIELANSRPTFADLILPPGVRR